MYLSRERVRAHYSILHFLLSQPSQKTAYSPRLQTITKVIGTRFVHSNSFLAEKASFQLSKKEEKWKLET